MMDIGKLIRLNRMQRQLTQGELCSGICSITHLSKIESGLTYVADDIIALLCARLGISLESERYKINYLTQQIAKFYEAILFMNHDEIEQLALLLRQNEDYISASTSFLRYQLYKFRYALIKNNDDEIEELAKLWIEERSHLDNSQSDLLNFHEGLYYLWKGNYNKAFERLVAIEQPHSLNGEYDYYLAVVNFHRNDSIVAYYHVQQALTHFATAHNIKRQMDTEMLHTILLSEGNSFSQQLAISKWEKLLYYYKETNDADRIARVYHNLGHTYTKLAQWEDAVRYFSLALEQSGKYTTNGLLSFYYCLLCKIHLGHTGDMRTLLFEGLTIAESLQNELLIHLFKIESFKWDSSSETSHYIATKALPFLVAKRTEVASHYGQYAFEQFIQQGDLQQATNIATLLLSSYITKQKGEPYYV